MTKVPKNHLNISIKWLKTIAKNMLSVFAFWQARQISHKFSSKLLLNVPRLWRGKFPLLTVLELEWKARRI